MANPLTLQPAEETAYQKQLLVLVRLPGHGVVAACVHTSSCRHRTGCLGHQLDGCAQTHRSTAAARWINVHVSVGEQLFPRPWDSRFSASKGGLQHSGCGSIHGLLSGFLGGHARLGAGSPEAGGGMLFRMVGPCRALDGFTQHAVSAHSRSWRHRSSCLVPLQYPERAAPPCRTQIFLPKNWHQSPQSPQSLVKYPYLVSSGPWTSPP